MTALEDLDLAPQTDNGPLTSRRLAHRRWSAPCKSAGANAAWTIPGRTWTVFRSSKDELQALIETIVVPETWFFETGRRSTRSRRFVASNGCPRMPTDACAS